jgi:16S rRNA (cytosine967-C5)-methyltransferase
MVGAVTRGSSLSTAFAGARIDRASLRAATLDFSYKTLRAYGRVDRLATMLTGKTLDAPELQGLVLVGLGELMARPHAAHTTVHQAVEAAALLDLGHARGLVNAVLRRYQRESVKLLATLEASAEGRYCHPQWWIERVQAAYPDDWQRILEQGNVHPPMTLRVNARRTTVQRYLAKLAAAGIAAQPLGGEAVLLAQPMGVETLPGFADGEVSVQDAGAQHAPDLLEAGNGMRVLDACAAPGGKAAHLLERADCELLAVDANGERARRINETFGRLGLEARVLVADSEKPESFAGERSFERILLDAPCTASGVARRHPDIKWLRRASDVTSFAALQARLLEALWRVLGPDGKLLYVTCSVFPEENSLQIDAFLARHAEAHLLPPPFEGGQILPGPVTDGFYYAVLHKQP